eukprot:CAMPEP_0172327214 /NCGR_PEP_ID=MMETSP1058-20130122/58949_1 /TAXON_ID=83371 /ORGANISM="Detonula confervacea, Strain CCMP 353" /LENGTH=575 /DNA_ID=CAMNT_0013044203 /DNA_START=121 /DNA_END=1848 /DNA_ORIENTATION=-
MTMVMQDYLVDALRIDRIGGPTELDGLEDVPLDKWWGDANPNDPRIAYERFIDACRLLVEESRKRDGYKYAIFGCNNPDGTVPLKYFANFLRSSKYQKLLPYWWTPQHDIAMFRYASRKGGGFYIFDKRQINDAIAIWGSPTARTLMGLAARIEKKIIKKSDEISSAIAEVFCGALTGDGTVPNRELGEYQGEGIPCRYGVGCKRRDCWFMHPKLVTPTGHLQRKEGGISTKYIVDHCIDMADGKEKLIKMLDFLQISVKSDHHVRRALIDPRNKKAALSQAEKFLHEEAKSGNSMAQYIWGKMQGEPCFTCLGKDGIQRNQMIKFWTSSALTGNAYAQMGLAKIHLDAGYLPVAIHWYKRSLGTAAVPEAAYYLGVAYGKQEFPDAGVPIQYEKSAKYYAEALGPSLPNINPFTSNADPDDMEHSLMFSVMIYGPNNTLQQEYQRYSMHNLDIVDLYLSYPDRAPIPNTKIAPLPVESTDTCALCERRPNQGEKALASCKSCYKVKYCNEICERGHWTEGHKADCNVAKSKTSKASDIESNSKGSRTEPWHMHKLHLLLASGFLLVGLVWRKYK